MLISATELAQSPWRLVFLDDGRIVLVTSIVLETAPAAAALARALESMARQAAASRPGNESGAAGAEAATGDKSPEAVLLAQILAELRALQRTVLHR